MRNRIQEFHDLYDLSRHAAEYISLTSQKCVDKYGFFTLVLSGGKTPGLLYKILSSPPYNTTIPWNRTHLFWGDERCVPPEHPESNYFLAHRSFISQVGISETNIHRISGELESPYEAAELYECELRDFFKISDTDYCTFPSFHLILLGMGSDGHTASLFHGDSALEQKRRWVAVSHAPEGISPSWRITLTLPVINNADRILFLVSGSKKPDIVKAILNDPKAMFTLPAARVSALREVIWYLDGMIHG